MSRWPAIAVNVVAFDALWTLALLGAGRPWWWVAPVAIGASAAAQVRRSPAPAREAGVILAGAAVGVALDWVGSGLGLFAYRGQSPGEFLVVFASLWVNFGTTLRPSLSWMWRRPMLAALLGAAGGPMAYWVGSRIGAITLGESVWKPLVWVGAQYAVVLPVWMLAAARLITAPAGTGPGRTEPGATR